jgi:hypothetical protein
LQKIAVCVARNSADVLPLAVLNSFMAGVDEVFVVDNGSTDNNIQVLRQIKKKFPRLKIIQDNGEFNQPLIFENVINNYISRKGETLVIPFDSDEIWQVSCDKLILHFKRFNYNCVISSVLNYVQYSSISNISRWEDILPKWRIVPRKGVSYETIVQGRRSMIQAQPKRKVIFVSSGPITMGYGQHKVDFAGKVGKKGDDFKCLHFPVRSRSALTKRIHDFAPRMLLTKTEKNQAWHMAALMESHQKFGEEALWRANSVRYGMLNINGRLWPCIPDLRLYRRIRDVVSFARAKGLNVEELYE